ncbi:MAG TPA: ABC transporter permease [Stellaceae bacterium]|jgi:osmoprotectant transport system permease protein|nr:ABC transporter permease [Stellaceae bacterium]
MSRQLHDAVASPALWVLVLFIVLLIGMPASAPLFHWAFPLVSPPVFERTTFLALFLSHAGMVAAASVASTLLGVGVAILVTRPAGRDFRPIANTLATIGQTFPPAAVLALAVPALGFGPRPTIIALFLYGLLPIIENSIAGLDGVPAAVRDAAAGMGLSAWQRLRDVELPLAAPAILAGVRVSVTIAIGTATIGSTVGALTLGTPIFDGLAGNKIPFVVQGAALVALFAIVTDMLFARLDRHLRITAAGGPPGEYFGNNAG